MSKYEKLFSPLKIGSITIKNRYAVGPMGGRHFIYNSMGAYSENGIDYWVELARGGFGLIVTGSNVANLTVDPFDPANGNPNPATHPGFFGYGARTVLERVHDYGAKMFLQISMGPGRMRDGKSCSAIPKYKEPDKLTDELTKEDIGEEDISNLIIQQIEFCNIILLNKAAEVKPEELEKIRAIIRTLQPGAEIIDCNYADVDLDKILHTGLFNFDRAATSAGWIRGIESRPTAEEEEAARNSRRDGDHHSHDEDDHEESLHHGHEDHHHGEDGHCHHHHHHDEGEAEEYGISTFVYYRRPAFDINRFDWFVAKKWPKSVIRAKGICYFSDERGMSYLFEQAGSQKQLRQAGQWYATAPEEDLIRLMQSDPGFMRDWDARYGDRMQKIVFIGQNMDREQITRDLDDCLEQE